MSVNYIFGSAGQTAIYQDENHGPIKFGTAAGVTAELGVDVVFTKPLTVPELEDIDVAQAPTGFVNLYFKKSSNSFVVKNDSGVEESAVSSATGPTGPQGIQGPTGPQGPSSINIQQVTSTSSVGTSSTSYVDLNSMSVTVSNSGTADYLVMFNGNCSSNNIDIYYIINVGGSVVTHSERICHPENDYDIASTQCVASSVPNGATIKIQYKTSLSNKSANFFNRSMIVMKLT